jgi:carboxyl-terminal processing protease
MSRTKKKNLFIIIFVLTLVVGGWVFNSQQAIGTDAFSSIREGFIIYKAVLDNVIKHYVDRDKVDVKGMIQNSIEGMLQNLDPYTKYVPESAYENLTIQTKGQYGGLGISIWILDKTLTVRSVFNGTPAANIGVEAGDRIIKIEGVSTKGITLDEAVQKLRGEPGTEVTIAIHRESFEKPLDFTITRDIIKVPSIEFAGILQDHIGYVRLTRFAKDTAAELKEAIRRMEKEGMKGLILDLRGNPGGLLQQAFEVGELFLPKGAMIVYTRGRHENQNQEFRANQEPLVKGMPLAVLVNRGSASASEIVAGAIQDLDQGLVIGKTTWGKGLVQTVLPVGKGNSALKITTAKYYTPSGRCIQRDFDQEKAEADSAAEDEAEEPAAPPEKKQPTAAEKVQEIFHTKGGRIVYGGGGITPDIEVELDTVSKIQLDLMRQNIFFKFAVHLTAQHPGKPDAYDKLMVDDRTVEAFKKFIQEQKFEYKSALEVELERFEKLLELEKQSQLTSQLDGVKKVITREKEKDFNKHRQAIKRMIKMELAAQYWGKEGRVQAGIEDDNQMEKALQILTDKREYKRLLTLAAKGDKRP